MIIIMIDTGIIIKIITVVIEIGGVIISLKDKKIKINIEIKGLGGILA